ncbi:MAG: hypothetical protein P8I03_14410 [Thalassotalea sp.]|nr:hypothetical protein [Thalassotalea sp.]
MKIQLLLTSDEVTIICEDGGIACIREAVPIDKDTPRIATSDYYQSRITDMDLSLIVDNDDECIDIWSLLAEGKIYHDDWEDKPFNSLFVINKALIWLGHNPDECVITEESLFPSVF